MNEAVAYKILTAEQAEILRRDGVFHGAPVDLADGYIHLSAAAQVAGTLRKHFSGQPGLVIAAVDLARCGDAVRWEVSRGGERFPHLYAPLAAAAVIAMGPVSHAADGSLLLPA
jgi:uncharacterized protein (DUF952 family)